MLTDEQTKTAYELLEQADKAFEAGEEILGSQKLWDAFVATVDAIARARGLPCRNDGDIHEALGRLSDSEDEHYSMMLRFHTASRFRDAVTKGFLEDYEVEIFRPEVHCIVNELANLA